MIPRQIAVNLIGLISLKNWIITCINNYHIVLKLKTSLKQSNTHLTKKVNGFGWAKLFTKYLNPKATLAINQAKSKAYITTPIKITVVTKEINDINALIQKVLYRNR